MQYYHKCWYINLIDRSSFINMTFAGANVTSPEEFELIMLHVMVYGIAVKFV